MRYNPFFQKFVAYLFILGILTSCNQYNTIPYMNSEAPSAENLILDDDGNINTDKIIIHSGGLTYKLSEAVSDKNNVSGKLVVFDIDKAASLTSSLEGLYEDTDQSEEELYAHFIDPSQALSEGDDIVISVYENTGEIVLMQREGEALKIIAAILVVIAGLIVGMAILLLIACNCPHAYVFDGKKYIYTNTLFTGAIAANLERDDYKILEDYLTKSSTYEMIVKNEENEAHYFNLLELIVVSHSENTEVIPDQNGKIHAVSNLISPKRIIDDRGEDLLRFMSDRDDLSYGFDSQSEESMINAYATFERPKNISNAKMIIKLKNSEWGGLVYKTFATMMGDKYEGWVEKNRKRSPQEAEEAMMEAGIPLVISVKNGDRWVEVETIDLVGEVNYNTLAVSLDEKYFTGDEIMLRLQAGFKFWDVDYIGMDFTKEQTLDVQVISPTMEDVAKLNALENDDDLYMEHLQNGDSTYFKFEGLNSTADKRTVIMHSKGYYLSNEEYEGDPYWKQLVKLRAPGGLSRLSKEIYSSYQRLVLEPSISQ